MKKFLRKTGICLLAAGLIMITPLSSILNQAGTVYADNRSAVIRGAAVNVRSGPGTDNSRVTTLTSNTQITVTSETTASDGYTWYGISFSGGSGYVRSDYVKFPVAYTTDAAFEAYLAQQGFPESYKPGLRQLHAEYPNWVFNALNTGMDFSAAVAGEMEGTNSLVDKDSISSWKSIENGKFDWTSSAWPGFDGAAWVAASQQIVEYYMDPRNFLDDSYVFQFAVHTYDPALQTLAGVQQMVKGTFLDASVPVESGSALAAGAGTSDAAADTSSAASGTSAAGTQTTGSGSETLIGYAAPDGTVSGGGTAETSAAETDTGNSAADSSTSGTGSTAVVSAAGPAGTVSGSQSASQSGAVSTAASAGYVMVPYASIIMEAAEQSKESPYVLTAMILQEQGKGTGNSVSGANGYYNYFNVGAYESGGMSAVERGLWFAAQSGSYGRPWNSIEKSIVGGALFYASNYMNAGQNTLYLKKWNVQGTDKFKHQYMTNVPGAAEEGASLSSAYTKDMRSAAHVFSIPVYSNMPSAACPLPTGDGNPNNKLSSLTVDGFVITPGFNMDTQAYTLVVDPAVSAVNVSAVPIHEGASVSGGGSISLASASTQVVLSVTAQNGSVRQYTITINRQAGGQQYNGTLAQSTSGQTAAAAVSSGTASSAGSSTVSAGTSVVEVGVGPTAG